MSITYLRQVSNSRKDIKSNIKNIFFYFQEGSIKHIEGNIGKDSPCCNMYFKKSISHRLEPEELKIIL